jgi:hypothetical protein
MKTAEIADYGPAKTEAFWSCGRPLTAWDGERAGCHRSPLQQKPRQQQYSRHQQGDIQHPANNFSHGAMDTALGLTATDPDQLCAM